MAFQFIWTLIMALTLSISAHDFHVSVAEIDIDMEEQGIAMAVHIFIDDLEKGLEMGGAPDSMFIGTPFEDPDGNLWIEGYLRRHLSVRMDGRQVPFDWVGKELSEDLQAVWVYLEGYWPGDSFEELDVRYDLLMEVYDDQKNMLHIRVDKDEKTTLLFSKRKNQHRYEIE